MVETFGALHLTAATSAAMEAIGARLAGGELPLKILLSGELGAGKTTLVRGFLRSLGYQGAVKSPTYTLVEPYELSQFTIYHFDFFRIRDPDELEFLGLDDYFSAQATCLIEWPERGASAIQADLRVDISVVGSGRDVRVQASSSLGSTVVASLAQ